MTDMLRQLLDCPPSIGAMQHIQVEQFNPIKVRLQPLYCLKKTILKKNVSNYKTGGSTSRPLNGIICTLGCQF